MKLAIEYALVNNLMKRLFISIYIYVSAVSYV